MLHNFFLSLHNEENVLIRLGSEKPHKSSGKMIQVRWCLEEKYYFLYDRTWEIYVRTLKWTKLVWSSLADGARLKSQKYFSLSHFLFVCFVRLTTCRLQVSSRVRKNEREPECEHMFSKTKYDKAGEWAANVVVSETLHPRSLILLIQLSEDFTAERVKRNLVVLQMGRLIWPTLFPSAFDAAAFESSLKCNSYCLQNVLTLLPLLAQKAIFFSWRA